MICSERVGPIIVTFLILNHVPPPPPRAVASTAPISCRACAAIGSRPGILAYSGPSPVPRLPTAMTPSSAPAATRPTRFSPGHLSARPPRHPPSIPAPSIRQPDAGAPRPPHAPAARRQRAIHAVFPPPAFPIEPSVDPENLHPPRTSPAAAPSIWPPIPGAAPDPPVPARGTATPDPAPPGADTQDNCSSDTLVAAHARAGSDPPAPDSNVCTCPPLQNIPELRHQ